MPDQILTEDDDAFDALVDGLPEDQLSVAFKTLRDQNKALKKETRELRPYKQTAIQAERSASFKAAGLPDDLSEKKQAALLVVAGDNPDAEGIKAAAIELGFITIDPATAPRAAAATDSQIAAQTQGTQGHVPGLPTLQDQIKAAQDAGDWKTAMRLKTQMIPVNPEGLAAS